jgi:hypothetical protein
MVDGEALVSLRVHPSKADPAFTILLAVEVPVLSIVDAEDSLSLINDAAGLAGGVQSARLVLLVELGDRLVVTTPSAGLYGCSVSSLYTFARDALTWLGIAHEGFPRLYGVFRERPVHG